jgi:hypothetical protein
MDSIKKSDERASYLTRDAVLKLLSDAEVGRVSTAETAASLAAGDEYLDLEGLDHGIQRAAGAPLPMGRVLPRKAVHADTWSKIVALLTTPRG